MIPRILGDDAILAVVSAVRVGPHQGHLVAYFGDPLPIDLRRANDWGSSSYFARTSAGWGEWSAPEDLREMDFELKPWIESGKLRWITPGDPTLEVRTGTAECPYLALGGSRRLQEIVAGHALADAPEA